MWGIGVFLNLLVAKMFPLLFLVVCAEALVAFLLMVEIGPLRQLIIDSLDRIKMRKGTVLTVAGTISVILLSDLYSIVKIQSKGAKHGIMTPMDQVLWRTNLLEATLKGFSLFLGFLIDRMHHYMRELIQFSSNNGVSGHVVEKLEREKSLFKEKQDKALAEVKQLKKERTILNDDLKSLKSESEKKDNRIQTAEAHVNALRRQAADLLLEYDRLLEDNQNIVNQL